MPAIISKVEVVRHLPGNAGTPRVGATLVNGSHTIGGTIY